MFCVHSTNPSKAQHWGNPFTGPSVFAVSVFTAALVGPWLSAEPTEWTVPAVGEE